MFLNQDHRKIVELTVLYEVTKTINSNLELSKMFDSISQILEIFLGLENISLFLKNEKTNKFDPIFNNKEAYPQNFLNELDIVIEKLSHDLNKKLLDDQMFFIQYNNELINFDDLEEDKLKEIIEDIILVLPLVEKNDLLGIIIFDKPRVFTETLTQDYLMLFNILATQISTAIINDRLRKYITSNSIVSSAVRDIAKIIETQYELDLVIPLMGEIMDKYIPNALVYIFRKEKDTDFRISWPNAYSKSIIDPLLEEVEITHNTVLSKDNRVIAIPLLHDDTLFGAVVGDAKISELPDEEIELIKEMAKQCIITVNRANIYAKTVKYATIDALTGLDNRRQVNKRLMQEASVVSRTKRPLSILLIDVDFFKNINDTYGHSAGDYVLKKMSKVFIKCIRDYDIVGRYGGEEFIVLLPDTSLEGARVLAERIRVGVEKTEFKLTKSLSEKEEIIKITVSIGVSSFDGKDKNPADIYDEADIALYKAKQEGRNKVVIFTE